MTDITEIVTKAADRIESVEKALHGQSTQLTEQSDKIAEINAALIDIAQKGTPTPRPVGSGGGAHLGNAIRKALKTPAFEAFHKGAMTTGPMDLAVGMKALTSIQGNESSEAGGVDVTRTDLGLQLQVFKPVRVLDVLQSRTVAGNTIGFNKLSFASGTNSADYQTAEGDEKAEQDLAANWIEAPVVTVAVHTTASSQVLDDEAMLLQGAENLLRYGLAEKVDRELLNGDGTTRKIDGLVTQASPFVAESGAAPADRIGAAGAYLQSVGYMPRVVFLNPMDWFAISSERTSEGNEYVAGGWNSPVSPSIYGMTVVPTPSIAQGTALVMDPSVALVGLRNSPTVQMSREHNGNFTKNLVTILAEMRLALLVTDPGGLLTVNLE